MAARSLLLRLDASGVIAVVKFHASAWIRRRHRIAPLVARAAVATAPPRATND
jgi:hypothetical protein